MIRYVVPVALPLLLEAQGDAPGSAQAVLNHPAFEVASIKLIANCGSIGSALDTSPGRLHIRCIPLRGHLRGAYTLGGETPKSLRVDVVGGPAWLDTDRYEISAKAEGGAPKIQMLGPMMRSLLEERLRLSVHKEFRNRAVYELTVAKNGAKLSPSTDGSCVSIGPGGPPTGARKPGGPRPKRCGQGGYRRAGAKLIADWYGVKIAEFADQMLATQVHRPVVDNTGLTGRYDIHLEFVPDDATLRPKMLNGEVSEAPTESPAPDASGPSIFAAVLEQLGLKLVPGTGRQEVMIIDHAERPTEN